MGRPKDGLLGRPESLQVRLGSERASGPGLFGDPCQYIWYLVLLLILNFLFSNVFIYKLYDL